MTLPVLITVSPLLFWGIWLIINESFVPEKPPKNSEIQSIFLPFAILFLSLLLLTRPTTRPLIIAVALIISAYSLKSKNLASKRKREYQEEINRELPVLIQILTILISSGLSPVRALDVISHDTNSRTGREFETIVYEVRGGRSITQSLDAFANRVDTPLARRFATTLILGIERGSPLVNVLTQLVGDSRNEAKNELLRRAGKAEIALLLPVVFLILPISILFALWPSFQQLNLSLGM